ncbi:hypothetical protein AC482_02910 [miscellaneous Crenarchaeota group-15 archaeon DG-45]|uniref:CoB--CoM heterodisulfide reductase iron-sulfur subunit A n=1 Tax=miscellaneous Crenarchaeota group-15 archaeon DG-45 TaxID=1685127 RepID=A0A0M0BQF1_9ARCH|nr:MAG: hypothetical protein AC482_02910 [miscellaneous Crenarchaeota group-15 archaeon DG-45]
MDNPYYIEKQRRIPIVHDVDVAVAGGGCAGTMAAVAAARNGADTLLIERYGFLGGAATAQYVPLLALWNLSPWADEEKPLIGGLAQEICERLDEVGGSIRPEEAFKAQKRGDFPSIWFHHDFELMKLVKQELCEEAGVNFLLHAYIASSIVEDDTVRGLIVENKSGRQAVMAKVVVDATGDGDVAARAGADFEQTKGSRIVDGVERGVMVVSNKAILANVDVAKLRGALKRNPNLIRDLMAEKVPDIIDDTVFYPPYGDKPPVYKGPRPGKLPEPYQSDPKYYAVTRPGEGAIGLINSYGRDVTDAEDMTEAELEIRSKIKRLLSFYKENVPGYENAYISTTPTQLGLRESRRIAGGYTLTEGDMLAGARFDDVILRNRIGEWDISEDGKLRDASELTAPYDIPYRCMVPKKMDGLLVAGRCISITHEAAIYFAPRDIVTAWGLGEAAGTAAALCVKEGVQPRRLAVRKLQAQLRKQGFNLG